MFINYAAFTSQVSSNHHESVKRLQQTLTSKACPSSKSNVTTQKQVTHLLKRSQGKTYPSKAVWRNISSSSQTAILVRTLSSCYISDGYKSLASFPVCPVSGALSAGSALWAINKSSWSLVLKWRVVATEQVIESEQYHVQMSYWSCLSKMVPLLLKFWTYLNYEFRFIL